VIEALQRYGPTQPLPVLVAELNKLYHEHEAASYESTHPEIFDQLPPLWREMLAEFDSVKRDDSRSGSSSDRKLRILNLGCGTGFEASQCLTYFGRERVERLVCYDPSERMLEQSRRALGPWGDSVQYISTLQDLAAPAREFDLIITNAVLHHMADPVQVIREITPFLSPKAIWLSGHEPSRRFYANPECMSVLRSYDARHRWTRFLSPRKFLRKLERLTRMVEFPADYAARRAHEQSFFCRRPPAWLVSRLVDYQLVLKESEIGVARGLDFIELQSALSDHWELLQHRTYSFLGPHYEGGQPARWRSEARRLAAMYPDDGASYCAIWRVVKSL